MHISPTLYTNRCPRTKSIWQIPASFFIFVAGRLFSTTNPPFVFEHRIHRCPNKGIALRTLGRFSCKTHTLSECRTESAPAQTGALERSLQADDFTNCTAASAHLPPLPSTGNTHRAKSCAVAFCRRPHGGSAQAASQKRLTISKHTSGHAPTG